MPGSPQISDRTWFGIARISDGSVVIEGPLGPWAGQHDHAKVLVMTSSGPTEWLSLAPDEVSEQGVLANLTTVTTEASSTPPLEIPEGDLTIAICTRDRPESLAACLRRFQEGAVAGYSILVIDNAPKTDATRQVVDELAADGLNVRRVVEARPGLSRARNAAIANATTEFVAFTDDDARPDGEWATALHRGFSAGENVAIVTGIVPPAEIETEAQALFEQKLKWSNNLTPELYSMAKKDAYPWPFPYSAGHFGTGANFAIRRSVALTLGGFDEALGAGTRTEGGEDMEMFVRVIRAGYELYFQPASIVWHIHRKSDDEARTVLFGYGKGLSAVAVREFLEPGRLEMIRGQLRGAKNLWGDRQGEIEYGMPKDHLMLEVAGVLYGPIAYALERVRGPKRR